MNESNKHDWVYDASCIGLPTDFFFPRATVNHQVLEICGRCPVRQACLQAAMEEEKSLKHRYGIRGGLQANERARLARQGVRNAYHTDWKDGA